MSMSFFKSKRINSDSKSSSKPGIDSDSKTQRNSSSGSSKSGTVMPPVSAPVSAVPNSKQPTSKPGQRVERSRSIDNAAWAEAGCPIDSRIMASTVSDKTLSISRSGRYKAKGKVRARLFSDESIDGTADNPDVDKRGASTLSPEDRQTVLQTMTMRSGTPSGRNPSSSQVKSDATSSKWSATPNSMDL